MNLNSVQKAKIVMRINFAILFIIIIVTPFYIREGILSFSEDAMETVFLAIELLALVIVFRHYEAEMTKKEEEALQLDVKLKKKERELLSAFEYLGKVNVQISMIKDLFEKMQVPSSKNHLKEMYSELLRIVCSVTKEDCAVLRVVNLKSGRLMSEFREDVEGRNKDCNIEAGSGELIRLYEKKSQDGINGHNVFYSKSENFLIKAFVIVPNEKEGEISKDERDFLEALANQCEIVFLLFNSKYFKTNNNQKANKK